MIKLKKQLKRSGIKYKYWRQDNSLLVSELQLLLKQKDDGYIHCYQTVKNPGVFGNYSCRHQRYSIAIKENTVEGILNKMLRFGIIYKWQIKRIMDGENEQKGTSKQ